MMENKGKDPKGSEKFFDNVKKWEDQDFLFYFSFLQDYQDAKNRTKFPSKRKLNEKPKSPYRKGQVKGKSENKDGFGK